MISLVLALALRQAADVTAPLEGVWVDGDGQVLFAGNNRLDWKRGDRYGSAMMTDVPDGTLLGIAVTGTDLEVRLFGPMRTAADELSFESGGTASTRRDGNPTSVAVPHLGPDPKTVAVPTNEVRLRIKGYAGYGRPAVIELEERKAIGATTAVTPYFRAMSMDALSLAGKYADKSLTIELDDTPGRTSGAVRGSLTYLGRRYSLAGKRIMGRVGFLLFDDSQLGVAGKGWAVWTPTPDRAVDIRNRDQSGTDQIDASFSLDDRSVGRGYRKTLKRAS